MDPFVAAVEEVAQALMADEDAEEAIADIAQEHDLPVVALRNRALRALGPFDTYKERQARSKKEREQTAMRRDPVLAGASFVAQASNLNPKLSPQEREAEIQRLAAEFGVDPREHRDAIERLRRR